MEQKNISKIITAITSLLVLIIILSYTHSSRAFFIKQAMFSIQHTAKEKAAHIQDSIDYAQSSVALLSNFCSSRMKEKELKNPDTILSAYTNKTPFNFIEYIRWDGANMMVVQDDGNHFDASEREYYKNGISGKQGIWINFTPKVSKEALLNFYTPLYFKDEVVGVITGAIGGQTSITPLLEDTFFGQKLIGILCDENYKVVATTSTDENIVPGIDLAEYTSNSLIGSIIEHGNNNDTNAFMYTEDGKKGICSVENIPSTNWKVIMIVLPQALKTSMAGISDRMTNLSLLIILVLFVYLFIRLYLNKRSTNLMEANKNRIIYELGEKQTEQQRKMDELLDTRNTQISILDSLAGIYLTSHLIDLKKDMVVEFNTSKEVRQFVNKITDATQQMKDVINATADKQYLDEMLAFTNLKTIGRRLKDKKILSKEFVSIYNGWVRASFIPVERDVNNVLEKVLFVTQVIEEEKRREQKLLSTANQDELTGLLNRHAYEADLIPLKTKGIGKDFVYISFDVNGLKTINDTLGHEAGDELICGAAECLSKAFGKYGSIYRTGGDEFQAMINIKKEKLEDLQKEFTEIIDSWTGQLVDEVRISAGYVSYSENLNMNILEIIRLADQRMYKAKSLYYSTKGIDRRAQQVAFEVLSQAYTKIIKVDLVQDKFSVIRMNENEQTSSMGFNEKISLWLHDFAITGQVHKDDKDDFLEKTDIDYLRKFFANGNKVLAIQYRRKIDGGFQRVVLEAMPAKDYSLENQIIFMYVKKL